MVLTEQQFLDGLTADQSTYFNGRLISIRDEYQAAYAQSVVDVSAAKDQLLAAEQEAHSATKTLLDEATAKLPELQAENDRLTALVPQPLGQRQVTPEQFLTRFSPDDLVTIDQSKDPRVIIAKLTLQTRESVIDLDSPLLAGMIDGLIAAGIPIDETERARIFA